MSRFIASVMIEVIADDLDSAKEVLRVLDDLGGFVNHDACGASWITEIDEAVPSWVPEEMPGLRDGPSSGDLCFRCRHLRGYHTEGGMCSELPGCQCVGFEFDPESRDVR